MMQSYPAPHPWVAALFNAHAQLALPLTAPLQPLYTLTAPVYRAAKEACTALGFIDADAECVAQAWQRQTDRTGHFDPAVWPSAAEDFGMLPIARAHAFAACPQRLGLYAVLPDAAWVARMAQAGVPTVQLRFKSDDPDAIESEVRAAVKAVEGTPALLFINDHWQAALRAGAYGVHLGQEDLDTADIQALRAAGMRLGISSHGYAEMLRADAHSPSYIALGAVFPTTLKRMATPPQGAARLAAYVRLMHAYPLVAIGGIDPGNLPQILETGVGSVAMVRALVAAPQPELIAAHVQTLLQAAAPCGTM
jgi:thiamine-phosphate pyrophosphorylase